MSKSSGEVIDPLDLVAEFGVDAFRFFMIRENNVGQDSEFSREQFLARYNGDLGNDLGNLVNRTLNMVGRFAAGNVPPAGTGEEPELELRALWDRTRDEYIALCGGFQFHTGLERIFAFVKAINAYIERRAPWKLAKSAEPADRARLQTALASMAEALRLAATAIRPVMPATSDQINSVLGTAAGPVWREDLEWGGRLSGNRTAAGLVLFPRPQ
jgi:methionyl-tRNA synthetase